MKVNYMKNLFNVGDIVAWNGKILEKGNGFVWKDLYSLLSINGRYKICCIIRELGGIYYKLKDLNGVDSSETPYYPSEVFVTIKQGISIRYDLR